MLRSDINKQRFVWSSDLLPASVMWKGVFKCKNLMQKYAKEMLHSMQDTLAIS